MNFGHKGVALRGSGIQSACGCIRACAVSCHSKSLPITLYPKEQCVELGKDKKNGRVGSSVGCLSLSNSIAEKLHVL